MDKTGYSFSWTTTYSLYLILNLFIKKSAGQGCLNPDRRFIYFRSAIESNLSYDFIIISIELYYFTYGAVRYIFKKRK